MTATNDRPGAGDAFPFPPGMSDGSAERPGGTPRPHHRTVDRVAAILETVARSRTPMGLSDIAKAVGAPVSSAQSLVNGLAATGYLAEEARGFRLGMAPYFLATLAGTRPVDQVTHQMLEDVVEGTGAVAVVAVLIGGSVFYIDYAVDDPAYAYLAQNRLRRPPLETSAGWILLSGLDMDTTWAELASAEAEGDHQDLVDAFQRAYPELRDSGECIAPGVASNGADGVAVAVKNRGDVVAAVSVIAGEEHIRRNADRILDRLRRCRGLWDQ
jgi:DNA-binding IclR family transcriptional regulator